jgi:hypothetical protein
MMAAEIAEPGYAVITRALNPRAAHMVQKRKLNIEPFGRAWRIYGPGVDMVFSRPSDVMESDLVPVNLRDLRPTDAN